MERLVEINCSKCHVKFNIPDDRLPSGREIAFPCPKCGDIIELDLRQEKDRKTDNSADEKQNLPTGEALKKKILKQVRDLPPMPQTVLKAREIMSDPNSDFKTLAKLFETDQAIAARVLKLANSPYYGLGGKVSSIQHASVVLGFKNLGELITMGGASNLLGKSLTGYGLDAGDLWKHSIAVAFGARIIAEKKQPELSNDAFTAGLIHDSGKLILDRFILERWELFEKYMQDGNHTFLDAEKEILKLDHSEAAFEVCKTWNIPKNITLAIRYHHDPSHSGGNILAYIVHLADAVAMMTGLGLGIDGILYKMDEKALSFLGLTEEFLSEIMVEAIDATKNISGQVTS